MYVGWGVYVGWGCSVPFPPASISPVVQRPVSPAGRSVPGPLWLPGKPRHRDSDRRNKQ